jgi:hypothetical protein
MLSTQQPNIRKMLLHRNPRHTSAGAPYSRVLTKRIGVGVRARARVKVKVKVRVRVRVRVKCQ